MPYTSLLEKNKKTRFTSESIKMHLKAFKKRKQNPFNSSNTVVMLEHSVIKGFPFNKSNKSIKGILVN